MNSSPDSIFRTLRAKKSQGSSAPLPDAAGGGTFPGPTTFFLRSEREVENLNSEAWERGRTVLREDNSEMMGEKEEEEEDMNLSATRTPLANSTTSDNFGVQSLADTIASQSSFETELSRTTSHDSNYSSGSFNATPAIDPRMPASRKRKAGNPVHPKILAAGQRLISAEYLQSSDSSATSPASRKSGIESPMRNHLRRTSVSSLGNISQPLTPLHMSPQPTSAIPSSPRSGSPKSFRMSDEEASVTSETGSQAIASSSSGEEEEEESSSKGKSMALPQLVMPSLAMPSRRPFTTRGREMGRLKVMVVGAKGVGKTSLIHSICRVCDDIVHVEPAETNGKQEDMRTILASTRPYPSWWMDFEGRRMLLRRKSIGDGVLERNLTFVDTPGLSSDDTVASRVMQYFETSLRRTTSVETMSDSEIIAMLSGEGGIQIDAVLYVIDAAALDSLEHENGLVDDSRETELLWYLCMWSNVIPIISRADTVDAETLPVRKKRCLDYFNRLRSEVSLGQNAHVPDPNTEGTSKYPYAVSSALCDDHDIIDASLLMSSSYLQPLVSSELDIFVSQLLEPANIARLRHLSAAKYLLWRQQNLGSHLDRQMRHLMDPRRRDENLASTGSLLEEPSKVLVPYGTSSYFRSASPGATSEASGSVSLSSSRGGASAYALNPVADTNGDPPFRQIRLAKWARDLQRSLENERQRYRAWYTNATSSPSSPSLPWATSVPDIEKDELDQDHHSGEFQLISTSSHPRRHHLAPKGRLGGALSVIDPRDPLGLLALQRRGWFVLRLVSAGAVAFWALRSLLPGGWEWWTNTWPWDWSWSVSGEMHAPVNVMGIPAPTMVSGSSSSATGIGMAGGPNSWMDGGWRGFFGWDR